MNQNVFLSSTLKGISQVILIENAISGLIILVGITIANVQLGIVAILSAFIGTWIGRVGGAAQPIVQQGLLGYNSVLSGMALFLFLDGVERWGIALVGAAITALLTASLTYLLRNSGLPVLTFPYIVLTWFFLLASYHLRLFQLSPSLFPQDLTHWKFQPNGNIHLIQGLGEGIGQVYFVDYMWSGLLILIGVIWANWRYGIYVLVGTGIAWLTAYGLGAEIKMLNHGLYGYNAVLTILAVAVVFRTEQRLALVMGVIAAIVTVPITAGLGSWLNPYGLPALTMPFVLVTWLFLGAKKILPKL